MLSKYALSGIIFTSSFALSMIPFVFQKVKKAFPLIVIFSAGMMLSVALFDIIPHLTQDAHCSSPNHSHHHHGNHSHDHKFNSGLFCTGLTFITLLAIDMFLLKHSHCDSEKVKENCNTKQSHCHDKEVTEDCPNLENHTVNLKNINDDCCADVLKYTTTKTQAFIFVFMISLHSFFEGLSSQSLNSYIALLIHKLVESLSIGITIKSANYSLPFAIVLNFFYCLFTPIGILIKGLSFFTWLELIFNGCALGAIFFIVFVEILPAFFHKKESSFLRIFSLAFGFVIPSLAYIK